MTTPDDPGLLAQVVDKAWAVVGILLGVVWKDHKDKFSKVEAQLDAKADAADVKRCLDHIEKLFVRAEEDREKNRDRYDRTMTMMIGMRKEIIDEVRIRNGN